MNKLISWSKPLRYLTVTIIVSLCYSLQNPLGIRDSQKNSTRVMYGRNIIYYDLSKIPVDSLTLDKEISLPDDLKKFLDNKFHNPEIQDSQRFEEMFWQEANKLEFTADKFKQMNIQQAIEAVVKVIGAKINYYDVDGDTNFIKEHGEHLSTDVYFDLGKGDCDKYRDATIAAFQIIKSLNPLLQNVYLSREDLGGNSAPRHAWVSIIIPQENRLILSHIDPTFYDNEGALEADDSHITLENNIFMAHFYRELSGHENWLYAYQIFEQAVPAIKSDKQLEEILDEMSSIAFLISIQNPELALEKILPIIQLYEAKEFTVTLDRLLYRSYNIYLAAGLIAEAENYKQRLLEEFPDSYWSDLIRKNNKLPANDEN